MIMWCGLGICPLQTSCCIVIPSVGDGASYLDLGDRSLMNGLAPSPWWRASSRSGSPGKTWLFKRECQRLGVVASGCNPSTLGGQGRGITWAQEFKTSLGNVMKPHLYKKLAWCGASIPSNSGGWDRRIAWTWEAEVVVSRDRTFVLHPALATRVKLLKNSLKENKETI